MIRCHHQVLNICLCLPFMTVHSSVCGIHEDQSPLVFKCQLHSCYGVGAVPVWALLAAWLVLVYVCVSYRLVTVKIRRRHVLWVTVFNSFISARTHFIDINVWQQGGSKNTTTTVEILSICIKKILIVTDCNHISLYITWMGSFWVFMYCLAASITFDLNLE